MKINFENQTFNCKPNRTTTSDYKSLLIFESAIKNQDSNATHTE